MRNVKNRLGVNRCCCQGFCEDCCNGNIPAEWNIDIDVSDGECTTCDEIIDGTYALARVGDQCFWRYDDWIDVNGWYEECDSAYTPYGDKFTRRALSMTVRCINETTYRVSVLLWIQANFDLGTAYGQNGTVYEIRNGQHLGRYYYILDVPFTDFKCDEVTDFEIPLSIAYISTFGQARIPPNPFTGMVVGDIGGGTPPTLPMGTVAGFNGVLFLKPVCEPPASIILTAVP